MYVYEYVLSIGNMYVCMFISIEGKIFKGTYVCVCVCVDVREDNREEDMYVCVCVSAKGVGCKKGGNKKGCI